MTESQKKIVCLNTFRKSSDYVIDNPDIQVSVMLVVE